MAASSIFSNLAVELDGAAAPAATVETANAGCTAMGSGIGLLVNAFFTLAFGLDAFGDGAMLDAEALIPGDGYAHRGQRAQTLTLD